MQLLDAANGHPSRFTSDASLGLVENNTQAVPSPLPLTRDPGFPPTAAEPLVRQKRGPSLSRQSPSLRRGHAWVRRANTSQPSDELAGRREFVLTQF